MEQVAVISDTHIPNRAQSIPGPFRDIIADADYVIHAGDLTTEHVLERLQDLASGPLVVVHGNMDPAGLGLSSVEVLELEELRFVVTHGTGSPAGYEDRVATVVADHDGDVGIAGHTHEVLDTEVNGIRLLNPGSVTGAAPAPRTTMMTAVVSGDTLVVTLHEQ